MKSDLIKMDVGWKFNILVSPRFEEAPIRHRRIIFPGVLDSDHLRKCEIKSNHSERLDY